MDTTIPCNDCMKLDPLKLRLCREKRAWTQEHLAQASGLSLRTIQRLEKDGLASADSRLALAAALEVELESLEAVTVPVAAPEEPRKRNKRLWRFQRHLTIYVAFCVFFLVLDVRPDGRVDWAPWPMLGWGIGVFFQAIKTFLPRDRD